MRANRPWETGTVQVVLLYCRCSHTSLYFRLDVAGVIPPESAVEVTDELSPLSIEIFTDIIGSYNAIRVPASYYLGGFCIRG